MIVPAKKQTIRSPTKFIFGSNINSGSNRINELNRQCKSVPVASCQRQVRTLIRCTNRSLSSEKESFMPSEFIRRTVTGFRVRGRSCPSPKGCSLHTACSCSDTQPGYLRKRREMSRGGHFRLRSMHIQVPTANSLHIFAIVSLCTVEKTFHYSGERMSGIININRYSLNSPIGVRWCSTQLTSRVTNLIV